MWLLAWYLGFVVAHDLIFVPLYTGIDRVMRRVLVPPATVPRTGVPLINHVRAPLLISGLLLIIYGPLILGLDGGEYLAWSGHHLEHYLSNWLLVTAGLFLGSSVIYVIRVARGHRSRRTGVAVATEARPRSTD